MQKAYLLCHEDKNNIRNNCISTPHTLCALSAYLFLGCSHDLRLVYASCPLFSASSGESDWPAVGGLGVSGASESCMMPTSRRQASSADEKDPSDQFYMHYSLCDP